MEVYQTSEQISTSEEDNQTDMLVVCAWHEEYVEGSTSTICPECLAKYFPEK